MHLSDVPVHDVPARGGKRQKRGRNTRSRFARADLRSAAPTLDAALRWPTPAAVNSALSGAGSSALARHLESVRHEVRSVQAELNSLRDRDEMLDCYMHRLDEELRLAGRLQQDFLPRSLPQLGPVAFHALFRPAGYVSGDLYDVTRVDERHIAFYIADAVGHGMPAALLTMFIRHELATHDTDDVKHRLLCPSESLSRLNAALLAEGLSHPAFLTVLCGVIDEQTLELTVARAGHPLPLVLPADGPPREVDCDGPLLGVFPNESFPDSITTLHPGERLMLYTDGIELVFCDGDKIDSRRWREQLLRPPRIHSTPQLLSEIEQAIDLQPAAKPKDDVTVVVMDVAEAGEI